MTIHLSEDLEQYVHEQVQAGRFPREDDVIFDALQRHRHSHLTQPTPNAALLAALEEVDAIQQGLNPSKVSPTQEYLDEARSGAMYLQPPVLISLEAETVPRRNPAGHRFGDLDSAWPG